MTGGAEVEAVFVSCPESIEFAFKTHVYYFFASTIAWPLLERTIDDAR